MRLPMYACFFVARKCPGWHKDRPSPEASHARCPSSTIPIEASVPWEHAVAPQSGVLAAKPLDRYGKLYREIIRVSCFTVPLRPGFGGSQGDGLEQRPGAPAESLRGGF